MIVHSLNFLQKSLLFKQSLNKHLDEVTSIFLNQSETTLLFCSKDAQIIVWKKIMIGSLRILLIIQFNNMGNKIVFIKDNQFISTQFKEQNILVFEKENQIFIQNPKSSIINEINQYVKFPFIYNSQYNQIICHHGQTINFSKIIIKQIISDSVKFFESTKWLIRRSGYK
ncbi:unnamed protein product [Paramecium pentaurelia]|uniref:Uncharacterized protein n=1 Tax=Paramecium pentaurelia TaxID=43138 RepID=A0A8S1UWH4_9CILI|nr:unnamed protein product [Paramecium pentaurelia]